ncbi:branched-chain amino acid aminotransferase [Muricauda sp. SCSIO 64092]|uniref:branched-chain amino acid aminotransferase n=1 Tax=Allomuricauda sp. SCSIO 64092 TaxID=2908842 RepID=UPI001FF669BC|nr:branched-chain amino acid aminotransferase [Muricauda sp. SCSIO 64092]UOY05543.1 branched-chain amino acid aminotransferase [Muricauda sp. SCSIO 64092]
MEVQSKHIAIEKSTTTKIHEVDFNNLSFGSVYTDHMLVSDYKNGTWSVPKIIPYQPIALDPASKIFHYGQSIFEGMKAYKDPEGQVWLFRPKDNHARLNKSAERMAIPELPQEYFMEGLTTLLELEKDWIPQSPGSSLYVRPFMFASGTGLHASPADEYKFLIALAPSGAYFSGKVKVLIEETYARAANGGVGYAKAGGNYAAQFYPTKLATDQGYQQVIWTDDHNHEYIEEAGAMNIFIRINDTLLTAPTSDRILDGITRKSILELAEDMGIETEVRKIKVSEVVEAAENGALKEMFGAGTAAVISPISAFGYKGEEYVLPELEHSYASTLKTKITDIQYNRAEDKFGWRYRVC